MLNPASLLLRLLVFIMMMHASIPGSAQVPARETVIALPADSGKTRLALGTLEWKFHPGDSLTWASPTFDDHDWNAVVPNFGSDGMPDGWTGFGWFRIWIRKPLASLTDTWGMYLNHDGAAEIYLDGKMIMAMGQLGNSASNSVSERNPYLTIPLSVSDTLPHLVAIRYCNYHRYFPDFVGFQAWIGDLHIMNQHQKNEQRFFDYLLMSGSAMAILALLHLLLFLFYRKQKVNLYYSLFVSFTALALFSRYITIVTTDPSLQVFFYKIFIVSIHTGPLLSWLLLYSVANRKIPRKLFFGILFISLVFIIYPLVNWKNDWAAIFSNPAHLATNLFSLLVYAEGTVQVFRAIRSGNRRLWLIASGMIILCIYGIFVGSNMFEFFSLRAVMGSMALICLLMPILFSIYIAIDVASTNRRLAVQLLENDRLANENLQKEQEKTKLISGQAEQLEKKVLERTVKVREQAEKLRELDAAKSRFFVNLTHEFKTPLTLIINPAKELLQQQNQAAVKQYATFILQNSERLLVLINQLLDLSRLESKLMEISYTDVDLVKWLRKHVDQFRSLAQRRGIKLSFHSVPTTAWMQADLDKMEKILQNLLSNAFKFMNDGGTIQVVFNRKSETQFELSVSDDGIGIPAEKLPYIFDRFYQADGSDTRSREGAGIGLSLVKEMVNLLGGTIEVRSIEKGGTTFTVTLPWQRAKSPMLFDDSEEENYSALTLAGSEEIYADNKSAHQQEIILVAEDNEQLRQFLELTLSERYTVITCRDGQEALGNAIQAIPDLVITDLMMPGMNGYQFCDALKNDERTSHIPVVMLTARTDQDSKIQGILTGADSYLTKPFDKTELLALITNLVDSRNKLREKYSRPENWLVQTAQLPSIEQKFLARVTECIRERMDDSLFGAEQLSGDVGLSRTQLHRKLKDTIGQSPGELIRSIRMQKAHELLKRQTATVAEAGYLVGYGNPANFSTSFSKYFGYPPSEVLIKP